MSFTIALAYPEKVSEPRAVITDETPTLETLWQSRGAIRQPKAVGLPKAIGLRFRVEELFHDLAILRSKGSKKKVR